MVSYMTAKPEEVKADWRKLGANPFHKLESSRDKISRAMLTSMERSFATPVMIRVFKVSNGCPMTTDDTPATNPLKASSVWGGFLSK